MRNAVGQPEPSIDLDLICWFCDAPFGRDALAEDAYLIPRHDRDGGPYRVYRCRKCDKVIHVERNRAGAYWARPPDSVPVLDKFFALFDGELAAEVERKRAWAQRSAGKRDWFHTEYVALLRAGKTAPPPRRKPSQGPFSGTDGTPRPHDRGKPSQGSFSGAEPPPPPPPPPEEEPAVELMDPWSILGVERGASREACVAAFRALAMKYHPDKFAHLDEAFQRLAHEKFVELKRAFDQLATDGAEEGKGP